MRYENSKLFSNSPCVVLMFTIGLPFSKTCLLANSMNPSLLFVVSCSRWHISDISQCHVYSCSYALWKFKIVFKFSMCCINVYHWLAIQQNLFVGKFSEPIVVIRRFLFKVTYLLRYKFHFGKKNVPCARCCATPISSRNRCKPYKLDRIATACMLMCCMRQNSVLLLFW